MSYQDELEDEAMLRNFFAVEAQNTCPINQWEHEQFAEFCFKRADAMLAASKK